MHSVEYINSLLDTFEEGPSFKFLEDLKTEYEDSFFPRVTNSIYADTGLRKNERIKLVETIDQFRYIKPLLEDAKIEAEEAKSDFSNSISIFHKNGEVSIVAIPVTESNEKLLGGFLLHHRLKRNPEYGNVIEDIYSVSEYIEPAEHYLKWRWWPLNKETRTTNQRSAGQIYLAGSNTTNRTIGNIATSFENIAELTNGERKPDLKEWQQAILSLESTKDFAKDAIIVTLEVGEVENLNLTLSNYNNYFSKKDAIFRELKSEIKQIVDNYVATTVEEMTIADFAQQIKGQNFPLARLNKVFSTNKRLGYEDGNLYYLETLMDLSSPPKVKDIRKLKEIFKKFDCEEKSVIKAVELIDSYEKDNAILLGIPSFEAMAKNHSDFISKLYVYRKYTELPYPSRRQFDSFYKLFEKGPKAVHLLARTEKDVKQLIGSEKQYFDENRVAAFANFVDPSESHDIYSTAVEYFEDNMATYQSLINGLGLNTLSLEQLSGFMAPEISQAIREIDVNTSGLLATMRSYQEFGVQYALHQKKIVLGDEMGLGKTITALGLAKHIDNEEGEFRALFTMPLAVLENWRREFSKHTDLKPLVIYGDEFENSLTNWIENGGVAITTFESIQKMNKDYRIAQVSSLDLMVVDETHFLKNPETNRSMAIVPWVQASEYAVLMSGTPLENNLQEFKNLIDYVQPNLEVNINASYIDFRKAIAPAYLRRNQSDVLTELPKKIDKKEYVSLSSADLEYYKRAVLNNDYHAARRAKVMAGEHSNTVKDIQSKVAEAMANNNKVIIFSYYLDTIEVLKRVLKEDDPYTPITGALNSSERQDVLDKFTKAKDPGVLLVQITAGGAGLNIQAASVVIIAEPQTKPSLESQAIGRAFRMGQTKPVQVFRMRGKDTIDEAWDAMLDNKRSIFSQTAGVSSDAVLDELMGTSMSSIFENEKKKFAVN